MKRNRKINIKYELKKVFTFFTSLGTDERSQNKAKRIQKEEKGMRKIIDSLKTDVSCLNRHLSSISNNETGIECIRDERMVEIARNGKADEEYFNRLMESQHHMIAGDAVRMLSVIYDMRKLLDLLEPEVQRTKEQHSRML